MKVELSGDHWVEMREADDLRAGDRLAVKRVIKIVRGEEGTSVFTGAVDDEQRVALLGRIITSWSYEGRPIPSEAMSPEASIEQLPLVDFNKLCSLLDDHMKAIDYTPSD